MNAWLAAPGAGWQVYSCRRLPFTIVHTPGPPGQYTSAHSPVSRLVSCPYGLLQFHCCPAHELHVVTSSATPRQLDGKGSEALQVNGLYSRHLPDTCSRTRRSDWDSVHV